MYNNIVEIRVYQHDENLTIGIMTHDISYASLIDRPSLMYFILLLTGSDSFITN